MSKRSIAILVAIVVLALILVVTVPPLLSSPSQIATKAPGTWQEVGEKPAYTMQVAKSGATYLVTYPRWQFDGEAFTLHGDKLLGGGGENSMNDAVKTIAYDNGSDQLAVSDQSGHSYTFVRVAEPAGITGVMREVGGLFGGPQPYADALLEVRWAAVDGPVVATTTSGQRGEFKLTVAPGEYWVVPVTNGDEQVGSDRVSVRPGAYSVAKPFFSVR